MKLEKISDRIHQKLVDLFQPTELEIVNESHLHAGHVGHRPSGETHFKVRIVSEGFKGIGRLERHRAVYDALASDMQEGGIHALTLETLDPSQI